MNLNEVKMGKYKITGLSRSYTKELVALGFVPGNHLEIMEGGNHVLLVKLKNTIIALNKIVAEKVIVSEV